MAWTLEWILKGARSHHASDVHLVRGLAPAVRINGQPARLAPGARIRGENNLIVLSGALAGRKLPVNYTVDPQGLVLDVWVLSAEERSRQPWPTTPAEAAAWRFDPSAQRWSKP